ncbi:MAG: lysophospholipid acyltransferase family protein [Alphaproteobacteria bacterium]
MLKLARWTLSLHFEARGLENLPTGPAILASKHQSAWETFALHLLVRDPVYVLKRELFLIPLVGWLMWRTGMIGIDRSRGTAALKGMVRGAAKALAERRQIIIFPEGTRTAPGATALYHPGVALLYQNFDVPLIPVALNSGLFWGRRSFLKYPGTVLVEFLPPVPAGLSRREFLSQLRDRIEGASERLAAEAYAAGTPTGETNPVEKLVDENESKTHH